MTRSESKAALVWQSGWSAVSDCARRLVSGEDKVEGDNVPHSHQVQTSERPVVQQPWGQMD